MGTVIPYADFENIELRVARVLSAERVPNSEKILKLRVDLGGEPPAERQIIAGIGKHYEPTALVGRAIVVVANLEPRMLMGLESQGMLLAADCAHEPVLLMPDREVPPGAIIR